MKRYVVDITTATGGGATGYTYKAAGRLTGFRYVKNATASVAFASTADFTITDEETGRTLLTVSNVNASTDYDVEGSRITTSGGSRTFSTGTAALRAVSGPIPIARSRVKIVVAQGGNTKTGRFHVFVD
jgi:hypothetical protein